MEQFKGTMSDTRVPSASVSGGSETDTHDPDRFKLKFLPDDYDRLLAIAMRRRSCREFSEEPIPEGYLEKVLEVSRWAMSGANSQPWNFIVVKDRDVIRQLFEAHIHDNMEYAFWVEQQRAFEYRHPGFMVQEEDPKKALQIKQSCRLWRDVPAVIAVVADGRKQWGSVLVSNTSGTRNSQMTDSISNCTMLIHLAAASLGLSTQWVTIHMEGPYRRILGVPEPLFLHTLIPIGYPAKLLRGCWKEKIANVTHYDHYDMGKHLDHRQALDRLAKIRVLSKQAYRTMLEESSVPQTAGDPTQPSGTQDI